MAQERKPNRRIEIHSPEPVEELLDDELSGGASDEQAISLEDLGDAYAAVLQMHQSIESRPSEINGVVSETDRSGQDDDGAESASESLLSIAGGRTGTSDAVATAGSGGNRPSVSPSASRDSTPAAVTWMGDSHSVPVSLVSILESICFVGTRDGTPIPLSFLVEALRDFSEAEIKDGIVSLNQQLLLQKSAMVVEEVGDGFKIALAPDLLKMAEGISGPVKESQLTQAAIDCLALIAYQPGITKDELEKQWGQPAGSILANLSKKGLIKTDSDPVGSSNTSEDSSAESFALSSQSPSKTQPRYFTTDRFLGILGLQSLDDLPRGDEL